MWSRNEVVRVDFEVFGPGLADDLVGCSPSQGLEAPPTAPQSTGNYTTISDANAVMGRSRCFRGRSGGAQPIFPQRTCMPRKRAFDPAKYKLLNRIEGTIGKLKQQQCIATSCSGSRHGRLAKGRRAY